MAISEHFSPVSRLHLNQFEECKTSLREGPGRLQGARLGPQGALAPPAPPPPGAPWAPWVPPSNWFYTPQTGYDDAWQTTVNINLSSY